MSKNTSSSLTIGKATVQSSYIPWTPPTTTWPNTTPIVNYFPSPPTEVYANEVEVEQHEHDATLRFYRRKGKGKTNRSLIKEITVPLGLLEWLQGDAKP